MTLSEIRRAIDALKRRFATELAIIKPAASPKPSPMTGIPTNRPNRTTSSSASSKPAACLPTFANLRRYLNDTRRQGDVPEPCDMVVNLLPWIDCGRYSELLDWDLPPQPSSPPLLPF